MSRGRKVLSLFAGMWVLLGFMALSPTPSMAMMDMFLIIDGIPGDSQDANHLGWIDVVDYKAGLNLTGSPSTFGEPTIADFSPLTIGKFLDKASPKLWLSLASGHVIPHVRLEVVKQVVPTTTLDSTSSIIPASQVIWRVVLTNVVISQLLTTTPKTATGALDLPQEQVAFIFEKIQWTFFSQQPDGSFKPITFGWDLKRNVRF